MIIQVNFGRRQSAATALDHAVREAARVYADQSLDGCRNGFEFVVHDTPADALYRRTPLIVADRVAGVDLQRLPAPEREAAADRTYHERFVTLAAALAYGRRVGQSSAQLVDDLTAGGGTDALADVARIDRQLHPLIRDTEQELWMTVLLARVDRFLDRNWPAIEQLATLACRAPLDADGWHLLAPTAVTAQLRRRPVKLSPCEQQSVDRRRNQARAAAGRTLARRLGLTRD